MARIRRSMAALKGLSMFYLDSGSDGTPILCLHGRWGRAETWMDFMETYGGRYRVIAPDQRGHGLSGKPISSYSSEEMAGDAAELLDCLGIGKAIVFGHSMGGAIAGRLAADRPERVLAAAILDKSSAGPRGPAARPEDIPPIDPVTKDWPLPFASRLEACEFIGGWAGSELSRDYFLSSLHETAAGWEMLFSAQAIAANIANYRDWTEALGRIECPVMLLRAKGGEAVPDRDWNLMRSSLRRVAAYEAPGSEHNVHLADKRAFHSFCGEFLGSLPSA